MVLALLVMLPRLASPQFGLLDDGLMLRTGREVIGNWSTVLYLIPETGRFFPAYWLTYAALFGVVGAWPLAFFAFNALVFAGVLAILGRLVLLGGGARLHAYVALILFAPSGPAVEAFYTLSKAEPLQVIWVGVSLLVAAASSVQTACGLRIGLAALGAVALLLGHATKETSLVLVPISLVWLAIAVCSDRRASVRLAATYASVSVAAALAFAGLRWYYAPLAVGHGSYTRAYSVDVFTVGAALFRICAWLVRDFSFLLPLLVLGVWSLIEAQGPTRRLMLYACVWMAGWLLVYLPWPATFEYYLFPFAFGAAALGGAVVGDTWRRLSRGGSAVRRYTASTMLATTAVLWALTVVNATIDARVQLAVDRANADLVEFLAGVPAHSHVVVNTAHTNEYVFELPMHLAEITKRSDIVVSHGLNATSITAPGRVVFVVTPEMANQPAPTVRIALDEPGVVHVNAALGGLLAGRGALVHRSGQQTNVLELGLQRLLCRLTAPPVLDASYCRSDRGVLYRRTFSYGWQVHRLDVR